METIIIFLVIASAAVLFSTTELSERLSKRTIFLIILGLIVFIGLILSL